MPLDHQGALSGVTYRIPALADVRDPSKAFADFADTLPPFPPVPPVMQVAQLTADINADVNHLYISEGANPVTVTLPATATAGDRVSIAQVGAGIVTVSGIAAGTPVTSGANTAVTAVWDGSKWVGLPFSFSGTRPAESSGGTITDANGFRYHVFSAPGTYTFISHKALTLEAYVVGGGADGTDGTTSAAGRAGGPGAVVVESAVTVGDWTFTTVIVGEPGHPSSFGSHAAAGGTVGGTGTPVTLPADWAAVVGETVVGGAGGTGDAAPDTFGVGGGAGVQTLAPYQQETESYSYTTGGSYSYDCSRPARAYQAEEGQRKQCGDAASCAPYGGDAYRKGPLCYRVIGMSETVVGEAQCPGGWFNDNGTCCTYVPNYVTKYTCDGDGNLSGTTCVKTCYGDNTQHHTGTRPKACNAGYTAVNGQCVDPRSPSGGKGGGGLVAVRYVHP